MFNVYLFVFLFQYFHSLYFLWVVSELIFFFTYVQWVGILVSLKYKEGWVFVIVL